MKYDGTSWESSFKNVERLFINAKGFYHMDSKSRELKKAHNAVILLPKII